MKTNVLTTIFCAAGSALLTVPGICLATGNNLSLDLKSVEGTWAIAEYRMADQREREGALSVIAVHAATVSRKYPDSAEPLVWEGVVLSSYAEARTGLGTNRLAREALDKLLQAERIDPTALDGAVYSSLGRLYHKGPRQVADLELAGEYYEKALAVNPDGIEANFFYGEFLYERGDITGALAHLDIACSTAVRPAHAVVDGGRQAQAEELRGSLKVVAAAEHLT